MNKFLVMSAIAVASLAAVSCKPTAKAPQKPDYQMSYTAGNVTLEMTKMPAGFFKMGMSSDNRKKVRNQRPSDQCPMESGNGRQ